MDEGADHGDALAFASGEAAGQVVRSGTQPDPFEERHGACDGGLVGARLPGEEGDQDVFQHRAMGKKVMGLEDEADAFAAKGGEGVVVEPGEAVAFEEDLAGVGAVEGADDVEEGALAGAGGSDDGDGLALADEEGGVAKDGEGRGVALGLIGLGDAPQLEERRRVTGDGREARGVGTAVGNVHGGSGRWLHWNLFLRYAPMAGALGFTSGPK